MKLVDLIGSGDEPGLVKTLQALNIYLLINHRSIVVMFQKSFKVKHSTTTDGLKKCLDLPGRSTLVTGDESGSGHQLTGDQYLGSEPNPKGKAFKK